MPACLSLSDNYHAYNQTHNEATFLTLNMRLFYRTDNRFPVGHMYGVRAHSWSTYCVHAHSLSTYCVCVLTL